MSRAAGLLIVFFSLRAAASPGVGARDAVHEALSSQAIAPEDEPKLPSAADAHARSAAGVVSRSVAVVGARGMLTAPGGTSSRAEAATKFAEKAAGNASPGNSDKTSNAAGQVRAADVRQYGNVKKQGNSASVGNGNGQGNANGQDNGKGNGKGKGNKNGH